MITVTIRHILYFLPFFTFVNFFINEHYIIRIFLFVHIDHFTQNDLESEMWKLSKNKIIYNNHRAQWTLTKMAHPLPTIMEWKVSSWVQTLKANEQCISYNFVLFDHIPKLFNKKKKIESQARNIKKKEEPYIWAGQNKFDQEENFNIRCNFIE